MVRRAEKKSENAGIPNKYKNTLNDLKDSLDIESPDQSNSLNRPGLIDTKSRNVPKFRYGSPNFSKKDCLDENISIMSLEPAPKIWDFQVRQCHNVPTFVSKSGRAQYEKSQRGREDGKGKKDREDREGKKIGGGYWGNKVNSVVRKNSDFEASVYHHIIYKY